MLKLFLIIFIEILNYLIFKISIKIIELLLAIIILPLIILYAIYSHIAYRKS